MLISIPTKCTRLSSNSEEILQDQGQDAVVILLNPVLEELQIVAVDGCVYSEGKGPERCDYLVNIVARQTSLFV